MCDEREGRRPSDLKSDASPTPPSGGADSLATICRFNVVGGKVERGGFERERMCVRERERKKARMREREGEKGRMSTLIYLNIILHTIIIYTLDIHYVYCIYVSIIVVSYIAMMMMIMSMIITDDFGEGEGT